MTHSVQIPMKDSFSEVRRFTLGWMTVVSLMIVGILLQAQQLDAAYQQAIPQEGGVYSEGIIGELSNLNPMFASGNANQAAARLLFDGLFEYDKNGILQPDIAESIEIDETSTIYTIQLREDIRWHDGSRLDADDVVFTFSTIQKPDARSPLLESWKDIGIEATDKFTVVFRLPNKFAPFQHSLTTGIVPEHVLADLQVNELRTSAFNQAPIGSGPFKFKGLDAETGKLELIKNEDYYEDSPFLNRFVLNTYADKTELTEAFNAGELTAASDLNAQDLTNTTEYQEFPMPLNNAVFSFYNTAVAPLNDATVRKALTQAIDRTMLLETADIFNQQIFGPLLPEQIGFNADKKQPKADVAAANAALDGAGWVRDPATQVRSKGGVPLSFTITSQAGGEFPEVSAYLKEAWREIGAAVEVELQSLDELRKERIVPHDYDVLVFGIALGADPDVFAYWHSSQTGEGGFNLSEYKSETADEALEAGRTRLDPELRAAKYGTFTDQWLKDTPAAALYRTRLNYFVSDGVLGVGTQQLIDPADRFNDVEKWAVSTQEGIRD